MDDESLRHLEAALAATPANGPLLEVVLKAWAEDSLFDRCIERVRSGSLSLDASPDARRLAAALCLEGGAADLALATATGDDAVSRIVRARALLALDRRPEGLVEYRAAVAASPAVEDPLLERSLRADVVQFPSRDGRPKLRVISNDDTDDTEISRVLQPALETITFADVGGLDDVKKTIHRKIILPYQKPSLFQRFRKRVGGGILMYGPPGCGKTMLARATAGECKATFFNVAISDVLDMFIGESERKLHALFEQARAKSPSVLFFDEVEALGARRSHTREATSSKLVSQFLAEMDGFAQDNHGVLILAATNVPWSVDAAFRRPGRFDRVLFVPPPDRDARAHQLRLMLEGRPLQGKIDVDFLAKNTAGFSGADLRELVETAADEAIEETIARGAEAPISDAHLQAALRQVKPTTLEWLSTARNYSRYANEAGQYDDVLEFLRRNGKA